MVDAVHNVYCFHELRRSQRFWKLAGYVMTSKIQQSRTMIGSLFKTGRVKVAVNPSAN